MNFIELQWDRLGRAFDILGGWDKLAPYVVALIIVIVSFVMAKTLARTAVAFLRHRGSEHRAVIVQKAVFFGVFLLGILLALNHLGIRLSGLLAAAGIFTVALGFAAQTSVSNVISGFFLFFDRPFSINDTVKIDQHLGTVISIDLLSTRIRTFDNLMVRIPNETLLKSTIINYTLYGVRRVEVPVNVAYGSDLKKTQRLLEDIMSRHPLILDEPQPVVLVDLLGDNGVQLLVRAWVERTDYITAKSELVTTIHDSLAAAGIEIPFPQRVVHVRGQGDALTPKAPADKNSETVGQA